MDHCHNTTATASTEDGILCANPYGLYHSTATEASQRRKVASFGCVKDIRHVRMRSGSDGSQWANRLLLASCSVAANEINVLDPDAEYSEVQRLPMNDLFARYNNDNDRCTNMFLEIDIAGNIIVAKSTSALYWFDSGLQFLGVSPLSPPTNTSQPMGASNSSVRQSPSIRTTARNMPITISALTGDIFVCNTQGWRIDVYRHWDPRVREMYRRRSALRFPLSKGVAFCSDVDFVFQNTTNL